MITISKTHLHKALFLLLGWGFMFSVHAGRPLTVDDANVNDVAKFRITPSQENGCNAGAVVGTARTTGDVSKGYVYALFSCNHARLGSLHSNLGMVDVSSSQRVGSWGLAWERAYGDVTAHVEVYGQQHDKPTWATGLRTNILPKLQLDGSVGRQAGQNLVTLGTKWMF